MSETGVVNWQSFAPITEYDHAGYVWISVLYSLVVSTIVLATRIWIKQKLWGHDGTTFAIAYVLFIGHFGAMISALKHGFGTTDSPQDEEPPRLGDIGNAVFAAEIFLLLSMTFAKCSILVFIIRLLARDSMQIRWACYAGMGIAAAWGVASAIALGAACSPSNLLMKDALQSCSDRSATWIGIAAFDVATEVLIVALPAALVAPLQMDLERKVQVVVTFLFRLGVAALAILHAVYIARYQQRSTPSLIFVPAAIVAESQVCWSLVTATLPNMKGFLRSFSTGFGHDMETFASTGDRGYGSRSRSRASGIQLSDMRRRKQDEPMPTAPNTGWEVNKESNVVQVTGGGLEDAHSVGSGRSSEMIIRKDTTTTVWRN